VSSFLNSQDSSLRFFFGLPGKIRFAGGMTSMFVFISHTFGPLTGYMIGVYVSSYFLATAVNNSPPYFSFKKHPSNPIIGLQLTKLSLQAFKHT